MTGVSGEVSNHQSRASSTIFHHKYPTKTIDYRRITLKCTEKSFEKEKTVERLETFGEQFMQRVFFVNYLFENEVETCLKSFLEMIQLLK